MPEADKFKKPEIKVVQDSCLWDSGRWDGWEIILGLISFFSRHLVAQNVGNIICVCYFLNIVFAIFSILSQIQNGTSFRKINSGTTTPGTASKS